MVQRAPASPEAPTAVKSAFLVVDVESVPDGDLLARVKYPGEGLSPEDAIERARQEAREASSRGSDFIPYTFQVPVAVTVLRVGADFRIQTVKCLDAPLFRSREIARMFWQGVGHYDKCKIVTFNGRGFDLPLLELAAFRHGVPAQKYFARGRNRFTGDIDLMDWLTNYGGARCFPGGLDLLAKLLGLPGKMDCSGDRVYDLHREGKSQEISDYCLCDTLDTYFVFLRTRVLTGDLSPEAERTIAAETRQWLAGQARDFPAIKGYLSRFGDPVM